MTLQSKEEVVRSIVFYGKVPLECLIHIGKRLVVGPLINPREVIFGPEFNRSNPLVVRDSKGPVNQCIQKSLSDI